LIRDFWLSANGRNSSCGSVDRCSIVSHGLTRGHHCNLGRSHGGGCRVECGRLQLYISSVRESVSICLCSDKKRHAQGEKWYEKAVKTVGSCGQAGVVDMLSHWTLFGRRNGLWATSTATASKPGRCSTLASKEHEVRQTWDLCFRQSVTPKYGNLLPISYRGLGSAYVKYFFIFHSKIRKWYNRYQSVTAVYYRKKF
jgi:hypothetical protein